MVMFLFNAYLAFQPARILFSSPRPLARSARLAVVSNPDVMMHLTKFL